MRAFACPNCRSLIFFDNHRCLTCDSRLGFDRGRADLVVLDDSSTKVRCANSVLVDCNWLVDPGAPQGLCDCCWLTRTRPADDDTDALAAFARAERAKRRLLFQLDHLRLPTTPRSADPGQGLAFDLLSSARQKVITGHANGVITIDLAEGHDPHREALRVKLAEPYRTLLGHLRHEIGHWYWNVLVRDTPFLDRFRDLFGDERADYGEALKQHYSAETETPDWSDTHVSNYAAAHPWEDWAETFAHYLHIRDTIQTAGAWGVHTDGPDLDLKLAWDAQLDVDPQEDVDTFDELARSWIALKMVLNQLNRSMGKDDLYPFRLTPTVVDKLRFVHVVVTSHRADG
ncbi:MAG TPA: putative zinc-binding metallopeptidase [Jatrophihabitans sp.]|uniref:zinc-binding metallopeptidase family protein n=1 Tax=Jatrophihabitans sp. TaxID=1932789 RepID=UPI002E0100CF|nr:putative zinc-binding metallopeptidase [Jatrophihabitans sp.]